MKKLSYFFAALLCGLSIEGFAQQPDRNAFNLKTMLPTSPEAAMLGRFGEIPVGLYTGTASFSVPIYTIHEGGLELPITLQYHGSGIKVADEASNVGLGWLLEPGGGIIHIVNGKKDNYNGDFLRASNPQGYDFLMNNTPIKQNHSSRQNIGWEVLPCDDGQLQGDSEVTLADILNGWGQPDLYQYSLPGGVSGKFFIHPDTHEYVLIDANSDLDIGRITSNEWWVKTLDGNKFYFDAGERANPNGNTTDASYTWKLTKIELSNGKEISLEYFQGYYETTSYTETFHTYMPYNIAPPEEDRVVEYFSTTTHDTQMLKRITTDDEIIEFNYEIELI